VAFSFSGHSFEISRTIDRGHGFHRMACGIAERSLMTLRSPACPLVNMLAAEKAKASLKSAAKSLLQ
jgi:hypothetical protein